MANRNTNIDLASLHDAIEAGIKAQFPSLATVEFYSEIRRDMPKPACLLELEEMDAAPEIDPGTEQLSVNARFAARFVIGFKTTRAKLAVRVLAASYAAFLRKTCQRWGLPVGPAEVIGCYQDDFEPELDQYEVWRVEWNQVLHLGQTIWTDEGEVPGVPLYSYVPDVGFGNEDKYETVIPNLPVIDLIIGDGGETLALLFDANRYFVEADA